MTRPDIEALSAAGAAKADCARTASPRYLTRAAVAGAFIFVGALLSCLSASWFCDAHPAVAKLLGAGTFSTALILIVLLGGELFTGTNNPLRGWVFPARRAAGVGPGLRW